MTLFERIGGETAVSEMVDSFYARVLGDPELRPFFENTTVERLTKMQKEFFAAALEGPIQTSDFDIARIHQGMGITQVHVTRFVNHLIDVLDEKQAIERRDAMSIVFQIATYSDQVVGDAGGADG